MPELPELLTPKEVARALHVSLATVRRQVHAGELPVVRIGRQLRFRTEDIRAYIDAQLAAP